MPYPLWCGSISRDLKKTHSEGTCIADTAHGSSAKIYCKADGYWWANVSGCGAIAVVPNSTGTTTGTTTGGVPANSAPSAGQVPNPAPPVSSKASPVPPVSSGSGPVNTQKCQDNNQPDGECHPSTSPMALVRPGEPTNLAAVNDETGVKLSWHAPESTSGSEISKYILSYKPNTDTKWEHIEVRYVSTEVYTTHVIPYSNFTGIAYNFKVSAFGNNLYSKESFINLNVKKPNNSATTDPPQVVLPIPTVTVRISGRSTYFSVSNLCSGCTIFVGTINMVPQTKHTCMSPSCTYHANSEFVVKDLNQSCFGFNFGTESKTGAAINKCSDDSMMPRYRLIISVPYGTGASPLTSDQKIADEICKRDSDIRTSSCVWSKLNSAKDKEVMIITDSKSEVSAKYTFNNGGLFASYADLYFDYKSFAPVKPLCIKLGNVLACLEDTDSTQRTIQLK